MPDEKPKLIKVTFEYEDHFDVLEGEEVCEKWMKQIEGPLVLHQLRTGAKMPELDEVNKHWKKITKEKETT